MGYLKNLHVLEHLQMLATLSWPRYVQDRFGSEELLSCNSFGSFSFGHQYLCPAKSYGLSHHELCWYNFTGLFLGFQANFVLEFLTPLTDGHNSFLELSGVLLERSFFLVVGRIELSALVWSTHSYSSSSGMEDWGGNTSTLNSLGCTLTEKEPGPCGAASTAIIMDAPKVKELMMRFNFQAARFSSHHLYEWPIFLVCRRDSQLQWCVRFLGHFVNLVQNSFKIMCIWYTSYNKVLDTVYWSYETCLLISWVHSISVMFWIR